MKTCQTMQSIGLIAGLPLLLLVTSVEGKCSAEVLAPLPFVLEYALWRGWQQAVLYTPDVNKGCQWAIMKLIKCMCVNGIASAINTAHAHVTRVRTRLGIIIFSTNIGQNTSVSLTKLITELHQMEMDTAAYDWLIIAESERNFSTINKILNATSIRFDQNLVTAFPYHKNRLNRLSGLCDNNFTYKTVLKEMNKFASVGSEKYIPRTQYCNNTDCSHKHVIVRTEFEKGYYKSSERFKNLSRNKTYVRNEAVFPLINSGFIHYNFSHKFEMMNISKFSLALQLSKWQRMHNYNTKARISQILLVQYFKVRINSTLYARFLGSWNRDRSMSGVDTPYPVEARNFLGEELVFGRCNSTGALSLDDDGPTSPASLDDVLHFFTIRLNATPITRYYSKLGLRTYEGTWSGLLGALMDNTVDLALEPVTAHTDRHDMQFIFPIAETMFNIYIRQQETSTVRDIFLAPFSARLISCVVAVAVAAALAIVFISRLAPEAKRQIGYTEAILWSTGILCQQGGTWTPPNPASSILLLVCLLFAVVTYNAYAAFITSVLSVRVASVDTVSAVLRSPDFKIGYIRNGADQMYLMSTKDIQLNAFYIRGYSNAENLVSSAEEGLARAANEDFAFFAGQRAARSTLRSVSQARGRCAIREVPVHSTRAYLAFPLPRNSPYARLTLVSLLQLRGAGSLARLEASLVPEMPQCAPPPGFASARAADVRSALLLLVTGYVAAFLLGIVEYCWKNRKELQDFVCTCYSRLVNVIKQI